MLSTHLWPAGGIIATLVSPFLPAMGARLVNWARHKRLVGPIVCWLFPAEGTHPNQRDVESQVGFNADLTDQSRYALRGTVQGGLRTAGKAPNLTEELQSLNASLQQLVDGIERTLDEVRELRVNTYGYQQHPALTSLTVV